jgi:hypothetical protein
MLRLIASLVAALVLTTPVVAQDFMDRVKQLEQQNAKRATEHESLKARVDALEAKILGQTTTEVSTSSISAYSTLYAISVASKLPLVIGCDCTPATGPYNVLRVEKSNGYFAPGKITVCVPMGDTLYKLCELSDTATAQQIQCQCGPGCICTVNGQVCSCASQVSYNQPFYGNMMGGMMGGGCANGQCGSGMGGMFTGMMGGGCAGGRCR